MIDPSSKIEIGKLQLFRSNIMTDNTENGGHEWKFAPKKWQYFLDWIRFVVVDNLLGGCAGWWPLVTNKPDASNKQTRREY